MDAQDGQDSIDALRLSWFRVEAVSSDAPMTARRLERGIHLTALG